MSHPHFSHHHSDGESEDEVNGFDPLRLPGTQDSEIDSADSLDADDLMCQCFMSLEALAVYEHISPEALTEYECISLEALTPHVHTCLLSFKWDHNVHSLDKAITLCKFAISRCPDGHPLKFGHLFRLGMALEEKGLEEEALGAYERALDGAPGDSNGLSLMSVCFYKIGALRKGRYDRLGEAEDLNKAISAQEASISCTAGEGEQLNETYVSLLHSLAVCWNLLKDKEDFARIQSYARKASIQCIQSNAHVALALCGIS
ncbi:hypothetical protein EV421DRAFT_1899394 [Armillaria borealis]|uniref:TPR-like protein n=1 Tax=Armillaria borealis TaxID=47425 RepID=A0AA39K0D2_9AGAR|nr:hypothetical protein EV421DRAFT_1899394 [Armillaria borealis]